MEMEQDFQGEEWVSYMVSSVKLQGTLHVATFIYDTNSLCWKPYISNLYVQCGSYVSTKRNIDAK